LLEHGVDEGGLAVVDVGDDGDIANVPRGLREEFLVVWGGAERAK
jgi:hypothetical protein